MDSTRIVGGLTLAALAYAAGCGTEAGNPPGPDPEVGTRESAATTTTIGPTYQSMTDGTTTQPRGYAASCALRDLGTNRDMLLVLGGLDGSGNPTRDWYLFDPTVVSPANQWVDHGTFGTSGTDERAYAEAMSMMWDGVPRACLLAGGMRGTAAPVATFTFQYNSTASPAMTISAAGNLNTGRKGMALLPCGSDRAIVIGGDNNSGVLTSNTIEIWNGSGSWSLGANGVTQKEIGVKRTELGAARSALYPANYVIAGGKLASGRTGQIEAIRVNARCDYDTVSVTTFANTPGTTALSNAIEGNVLINVFDQDFFVSAGGYNGTTTPTATQGVSLDFTLATPTITSISAGPSLPTSGTHRPKLVNFGARYLTGIPTPRHLLIGGDNGAGTTLSSVHELRSQGKNPPAWMTLQNLTSGTRATPATAWLPSQGVFSQCTGGHQESAYVSGGYSSTGSSAIATTEGITVED